MIILFTLIYIKNKRLIFKQEIISMQLWAAFQISDQVTEPF